jgi:tripartite-type tricarboxylate transporter receptor subunit TctC
MIAHGAAAALLTVVTVEASAQGATSYPTKPIRYIVGYTPGGTADMLARAVGQKLTEAWGSR